MKQKIITQQIAKWAPLSFIDMHGYVEGLLIEPTTPPHNPTLYVTENKDELYKSQLGVFKRGVDSEDNKAVDKNFTNAADEEIIRLKRDNASFFPNYYVIPKDEKNQKNILEAFKEMEYLLRSKLRDEQTTKDTNVNGKEYPKGTFVIPMNQAKRGFINAMLFGGKNESC